MQFLWWIVVGLIAGWITGKIMRSSGQGWLLDIVIGIAGALVGGFVMRLLGFQGRGGFIYTVLLAIAGAVALTWLYRLTFGRRTNKSLDRPSSRDDWPKAA
jgi:uncharacterized membrane protein YeaQ/YmgE (transglycosylase-associated protein family)